MIQIFALGYQLILSVIILLSKPKKQGLVFAFTLISLLIWGIANLVFRTSSLYEYSLISARVAFASGISSALLFLYFSILFPVEFKKNFLIKSIIALGILMFLLSLTIGIVSGVEIRNNLIEPVYSFLYLPYIGVILLNILMGLGILIRKLFLLKSSQRTQIKIILLGLILTIIFLVFTNIFIPIVFSTSFYSQFGPIGLLFLTTATAYAILRYKLFDIRVLLGRITYYALLTVLVLITYRVVLLVNNYLWGSALDIRGMLSGAFFAFFFVIAYDEIKKFIQSSITSRLINPGFEPNEVIVSFNKEISGLLDYEEIAELLDRTAEKTIRPNHISVFVKLEEKNKIILKTQSDESKIALNYDNIYALWAKSTYMPIFLDQIELEVPRQFSASFHELSLVIEEMKAKNVKLILPIGVNENSNGILILGSKEGDSSYNSVQIKYLESLCEITSLALNRAKLYEEVQEFNETLQQKVKDATIEIQSQNSKLSEALRVERDMLDVLGHELRTPLGTIRNAMGVMELKYRNKQFTNDDLESFLKIGTENIRREIQLLETILASAKIDNDKLDMNFEKVEANDVVEDSFEAYKYDAGKKGLQLVKTVPSDILFAYADRLRIQQVMDNLVSNSVKYTQTGQVEIKLEDEGKYVRFSVSDTGEGIPEEDIAKLGTKFFRANMYLKSDGKLGDRKIVRPGGTGIGLYVVYQIVKYMYGEVKVTSSLGKGSTFSFTVLKYTEELANKNSFILAGKDSVRTYNKE